MPCHISDMCYLRAEELGLSDDDISIQLYT